MDICVTGCETAYCHSSGSINKLCDRVSKNITIGSHVTPMLTEWFCTGSSTHFKHIKLRFGCLLLSLSHRVDMPAALKTMKMFESTNGCYTKREDNFLHCQRMKVVSYFTFVRLFRLK